jgi:transcriptional regulator with XRE-family HTH domain
MPELPSSAVRRALASALRRLREHAGMSGDDVADRLGWSASKVSRIETHRTGIKPRDLESLLSLYGVDDAQRSQLRALADEQTARGWWAAYSNTFDGDYISYISLEDSATSFRAWSPELIHGLLQTEDYARATMRSVFGWPPRLPPGEIQRRIDARMRRQALLTRPELKPKEFTFIQDEAALRHRFGTAEVMRAQLALLEQVSQLPNVTIRVLAFAGQHPIGPGGFAILHFAPVHGTTLDDIVYMEQLTRNIFVEEEAETYEYRLAFQQLTDEALDEDSSRALIASVAAEMWS